MSNVTVEEATPEQIIEQLREVRMRIPEFVQLPKPDAASLARVAHVDADFIQSTISAVGASEALRNALGRSAEELRQDTEFTARWSAVVSELQAMLTGVSTAVTLRRHRIGLTALQTYQISRQLARQKDHSDLFPHIQAMRMHNKFGTRKRSATPPAELRKP